MGLSRKLKKLGKSAVSEAIGDNYEAWPITDEDWTAYTQAREQFDDSDRTLIKFRPPRENDGIEAAQELLTTVHDVRTNFLGYNVSHTHSHEIWYNDGQVQFFYAPETSIDSKQFIRQVRNDYPDVDPVVGGTDPWPHFEPGDYVAAATVHPAKAFYYPIKSPLTAGESLDRDPYGNITSDMVVERAQSQSGAQVTSSECSVVVQTMFHPAHDSWSKRRPFGYDVDEVAHSMKEGSIKGNVIKGYELRDAPSKQKRAAKTIEKQRGTKAYYATIRVFAISPYKDIAERRCRLVAQNYESYHNTLTEQTLRPDPVQPSKVSDLLAKGVSRTKEVSIWERLSAGKFIVTIPELAAIAHLPNEDINTPSVEWSKEASGAGVPANSPQFDEVRRQHEEGPQNKDETMEVLNPGSGGHRTRKGGDPTPTEQRSSANSNADSGPDKTRSQSNQRPRSQSPNQPPTEEQTASDTRTAPDSAKRPNSRGGGDSEPEQAAGDQASSLEDETSDPAPADPERPPTTETDTVDESRTRQSNQNTTPAADRSRSQTPPDHFGENPDSKQTGGHSSTSSRSGGGGSRNAGHPDRSVDDTTDGEDSETSDSTDEDYGFLPDEEDVRR